MLYFWCLLHTVIWISYYSCLQAWAWEASLTAGGSSYALDQPLTALLCTRAMTLTSHHHHWNECLWGQEKWATIVIATLIWNPGEVGRRAWLPDGEPTCQTLLTWTRLEDISGSHFSINLHKLKAIFISFLENKKAMHDAFSHQEVISKGPSLVTRQCGKSTMDYSKEHGLQSPEPYVPSAIILHMNLAWCLNHYSISVLIFKVRNPYQLPQKAFRRFK